MRTTQRLTMTAALACTALVGAVAFVAWPDERPTVAAADGAQQADAQGPTAATSGTPPRSNRAERAPAVRTVRPRDHHTPATIPTIEQPHGHVPSTTSPNHPKQGAPNHPKQGAPTHPKQGSTTQQPPPQQPQQPLPGPRFDSVTSSSDSQADVSSDGEAFTVGYSAFEVKASVDKAGTRHAKKTVAVDLRMAKGTRQGRVAIAVQGYAFTQEAWGSLTISAGGRQTSHWFSDGQDDSYLQTLDLPTAPGSTVRVSITVDVQLRADSKDGFGDLVVDTVDAAFV